MTHKEYLLVHLIEECSEIQKAASKALRFGLEDRNPNTPNRNNAEDIAIELIDLLTIRDMLLHNNDIPTLDEEDLKEQKRKRINEYIKLSEKLGCINVD